MSSRRRRGRRGYEQPLDVTVTAVIEEDGAFPAYLTVPDSAERVTVRLQQRLS